MQSNPSFTSNPSTRTWTVPVQSTTYNNNNSNSKNNNNNNDIYNVHIKRQNRSGFWSRGGWAQKYFTPPPPPPPRERERERERERTVVMETHSSYQLSLVPTSAPRLLLQSPLYMLSNEGYFICTFPQTGWHVPRALLQQSLSTGWNER